MENWKEIKGYEGLYEISDAGNVRSVDRCITYSNGVKHNYKGKIIVPVIHRNYYAVTLHKDNKKRTFKVHRLVAEAFIENPLNLPYVNHKDENKLNNSVSNLEWCTAQYNSNYGNSQLKKSNSCKKPIFQLDLEGNIIKLWNSPSDVENELGISCSSISNFIAGRSKSAGGYGWRY